MSQKDPIRIIKKQRYMLHGLGPTENGTCKDAKAQMKDEKFRHQKYNIANQC